MSALAKNKTAARNRSEASYI